MRMNADQFADMILRKESPAEYQQRTQKLNQLVQERDFLVDALDMLTSDDRNYMKKKTRLDRVLKQIDTLK